MLLKLLHPRIISQFESDAKTQVKFHLFMAWFWAITIPATAIMWWPHNTPALIQLIILEVSLWANFATHLGALAAAQSSNKADRTTRQDIPLAIE